MGIIKLLDENTINKIAAGEVIEKPASIVKELVENSIDAGASEISVEVKGGGISYIRIVDNGKGINKEDMGIAFMRHATSKLSSEQELNKLVTLGFRGEALASIAAVSKVEMISKTHDSISGYRIYIEGGKIIEEGEYGCPEGTVVTIRDVFFNTPARLKFLKSESKESMYITDIMQNLAMSHSNISFKYISNGKLVFATRGDGDLKGVILAVYGKQIVKNLIDLNCSRDFITVKGYLGNSNISRGSRNYQSTFINGRYIKNKTITAAVEAAYKSMLTINKFPFFVLHIYVNPEFVDVNVHPAKAEVKFQDEQLIFKSIYHCVKDALISASHVPEIEDDRKEFIRNIQKVNYSQQKLDIKTDIETDKKYDGMIANENLTDSYELPRKDIPLNRNDDIYYEKDKTQYEPEGDRSISVGNYKIPNNFENEVTTKRVPKFGPLAVVGQIHFTYIIAEGPDDMYIIDQHAAHERIYYEKYLRDYKSFGMQKQNLIVPIVLEFSVSEKQAIFDNIEQFKRLGYEIEDFGGNSVALRCVPIIYGNPDPKVLFYEILEQINLNDKNVLSAIDKILYTMACKSAVKANDKLSYKEMVELIEQLRFCDNPYNCPHGRPTIIKMSYIELEKKFKRIQ